MATTEFYNNNALQLIERYDNANLSSLHHIFLQYIPNNSNILDIGFGSGRDLKFLKDNGYNIWGIDPSEKFIDNAKKRFADISNHFIQTAVPFTSNKLPFSIKFDAVISIAMWMHLEKKEYQNVIRNIADISTNKSTVIISYSQGKRTHDERYFEDIDLIYMTKLFKQYNFHLLTSITNSDSLNREALTWVTVVFKHD